MPTDKLNGTALASMAIGAILLYSGITGKAVLGTIQSVVSGKNPANVPNTTPIAGQDTTQIEAIASQGLPTSGNSGPITNASQAKAYAFGQFGKYGWGVDQQSPLVSLWQQESSWDANSVNPGTQAYGIPQALPSAQGHPYQLGWSAAASQIQWGLSYIHQRYSTPASAWAHEQANSWY